MNQPLHVPVVVVGGGITGLAAAHELQLADQDFVLLEARPRLGGNVLSSVIADVGATFAVDEAADGFLARLPDVFELCDEISLGDELVAPLTNRAFVWSDSKLRPFPTPSVLGVPLDNDALAMSGIVSASGLADFATRIDRGAPPLRADSSVGAVLRPRVGDEVFERIIDPLLGGINAGNADLLSIDVGAAVLAQAARAGGSFRDALQSDMNRITGSETASHRDHSATRSTGAATSGPVFNSIRGGTARLVEALAKRIGNRARVGEAVTGLRSISGGWEVITSKSVIATDAVILTTPAWVTAELIAFLAPDGANFLSQIEYSDVVLVTFVIPRSEIEHPLDGSGFLVARREGLLMTACSWTSSKWAHYNDGVHAVLRVSSGRTDDRRWLDFETPDLVKVLSDEVRATIGMRGEPAFRVSPWRRSLPQYRPGHLDRCDELDAELAVAAPGLVVAGAQTRGLGLPVCVRQGRQSARRIL